MIRKGQTMWRLLTVICVSVLAAPAAIAQRAELDHALQTLSQYGSTAGLDGLDETIGLIEKYMPIGDAEAWARLKTVLKSPHAPLKVRVRVLRIGALKADANVAAEILELAREWTETIASRGERSLGRERHARTRLVAEFVRLLDADTRLAAILLHQRETFDVLFQVATDAVVDPRIKNRAIQIAAKDSIPADRRRTFAEALVVEYAHEDPLPPAVVRLLDETSLPMLRRLVEKSDDPDTFHYGAASALAHFGDSAIKSHLKRLIPAFHERNRNLGKRLEYYVWQIEVQQSDQSILDFLGDTEFHGWVARPWLIRRALDRGLNPQAIRDAILKYSGRLTPDSVIRVEGYEIRRWPEVIGVKREAVRLGVLDGDDLPNVALPEDGPRP
jgi:hypothetical protein